MQDGVGGEFGDAQLDVVEAFGPAPLGKGLGDEPPGGAGCGPASVEELPAALDVGVGGRCRGQGESVRLAGRVLGMVNSQPL